MFSIHAAESLSILPEVVKEKAVKHHSAQTEILYNVESECQVPQVADIQVQTQTTERHNNTFVEFDVESLSSFLHQVTPFVCSVLEKNCKSSAFESYKPLQDDENSLISSLHVLEKHALHYGFYPSCVSWNSTGSSIAVSYASKIHESWCEHDSSVDVWRLNSKDFDSAKAKTVLETDCCITCVSFHPELPAILVAGKFNGEIMLWNIAKDDDPLLGSSEATLGNHREPITGLHWLFDSKAHNKIEFVSCSLDGKILLWKLSKGILVPYDGFIVLTDQLPRKLGIKSTRQNSEVGITSLSINAEDPSIFMIGIEGGGIFQCTFNSAMPASYTADSTVSLKNPINMSFEQHQGHVSCVQFSAFSRNIFLSCGTDGEIRIYNLLQPKPLITLHLPSGSVVSTEWSPVRPLVLSCISSDSQLYVWDLTTNEKLVQTFPLTSERTRGCLIKCNQKNYDLLATGTENGKVQIWQLSTSMIETVVNEFKQLHELAKEIR